MNKHYNFTLHVETPDRERHTSCFEVDAYCAKQLQPYDLCTSVMTAMMVDGVTSQGAKRIDEDRENLAKDIASKLTEVILDSIKTQDLRNGYPQE